MKRNSFEGMSIEELWSIHEELVSILETKIEAERLELERQLAVLRPPSEMNGFSHRAERRPYPPVQQKYRNPDRPSQTWSGRGKQPRWVSDLLKSGKNIDDIRI
jgi:DNA-binding protein H-NS